MLTAKLRFAVLRVLCASAVILAVAGALAPLGCAGSPAQKATQTVAPDSATASTLKNVQAQIVSLSQQNTAIINAIQKSAQDNDTFRNEVKGSIASLTQVQFRFESWLAEVSDGWRLRVLGCAPYHPAGQAGPELVDGSDRERNPAGSDARSAGAGADAKGPVLKEGRAGAPKKGGPSMFWLIVAFVTGVIASQIFEALEPAVQAKATAEEESIYGRIIKLLHGAWSAIFGGKKKKAAATPPPPK